MDNLNVTPDAEATLLKTLADARTQYARTLWNIQTRVTSALDLERVMEYDATYLEHAGQALKTLARTVENAERLLAEYRAFVATGN